MKHSTQKNFRKLLLLSNFFTLKTFEQLYIIFKVPSPCFEQFICSWGSFVLFPFQWWSKNISITECLLIQRHWVINVCNGFPMNCFPTTRNKVFHCVEYKLRVGSVHHQQGNLKKKKISFSLGKSLPKAKCHAKRLKTP